MSQEKRSLAELMQEDDKNVEQNQQLHSSTATKQTDAEKLPPSRRGKRPYTIWLDESSHKIIRVTAAEEDISQEQVGKNALNHYFRHIGKAPIA